MNKYTVTVSRTESRSLDIEVLANNPEEADRKALEAAGDKEFPSGSDAVYAVEFSIAERAQ